MIYTYRQTETENDGYFDKNTMKSSGVKTAGSLTALERHRCQE